MEKLFSIEQEQVKLSRQHKIIKKADLQAYFTANEIIAQSQEHAQDIEHKAQEQYDKRYEEGLTQGREEGKEEYSMKIMETVMQTLDSLEGLEQQIVQVVLQSVAKIIGEFTAEERMIRIVKNALSHVRGENKIVIKVSLQDEDIVRENLHSFLLSADGANGYIEIIGDVNMHQGDCIVETQMGVVEASLRTQMRILETTLKDRVSK